MVVKITYGGILTLCCVLLTSLLIIQSPAFALVVSQQLQVNGTTTLATLYDDGFIPSEQVVYVNGIAYVNITYDDGSAGLVTIKNYIESQQSGWSSDRMGARLDEVVTAVGEAADYRVGNTDYLSDQNKALLGALDAIAIANVGDFYNNDFKNLQSQVTENRGMTQNNVYEIEALYVTLEKLAPDMYCESKREVVKKYGLTAVKCGLHSKICYNGDLSSLEGGRDYCIHSDNDEDYLPCINTIGRCGRLDSIAVLPSEASSLTPVKVSFTNTGKMALSPKIKIEVYEIDGYAPVKIFEQKLGEILSGETKNFTLYFDNSGLEAGKKYELRATLSSGRKEILDSIEYKLLQERTFNRTGTLMASQTEPGFGETVQINGTYLNTGENAYSTEMTLEIFLDNKKVAESNSKPLVFRPGEAKTFTMSYIPEKEGNYTIFAGVEGTKIREIFTFEIKNPKENKTTGLFSVMGFLWE